MRHMHTATMVDVRLHNGRPSKCARCLAMATAGVVGVLEEEHAFLAWQARGMSAGAAAQQAQRRGGAAGQAQQGRRSTAGASGQEQHSRHSKAGAAQQVQHSRHSRAGRAGAAAGQAQ